MKYRVAMVLLCTLAIVKVVADVLGLQGLSAVAAVTNAAPAMKVFTAHRGYETYSSTFELTVEYADGQPLVRVLDPANYSGLQGPYNRRNVYGALIAYGPVLVANEATREMWETMAGNAFCGNASVLIELGFDKPSAVRSAMIRYLGQVKNRAEYPDVLYVDCP